MITYQAKDFNNRENLEKIIITNLGKTTEKKDATITGTTNELLQLQLSHGQVVWGVAVKATDFVSSPVVDIPFRGKKFKSSLNYYKDETN